MNGFLVTLNYTMDDIPLGIFESEVQARGFSENLDPEGIVVRNALRVQSSDASDYICVTLTRFVNGCPVSSEVVRKLD